jgi:hypothetical protein
MGTLLRAKYNFSVLGKAREAYSAAFFDHSTPIDESLSDPAIDALNLVRNLLVHNVGIADDLYVDRTPGTPAPVLGRGEELKLDGALVAELISPVIKRSTSLIAAVDRWVQDESDGKHLQPKKHRRPADP